MIVETPDAESVTGHAADMYDNDLRGDGFVFAYTQVMAVNPDAHQAFETLVRAIVPSIGVRTYELATLGAARAIGSEHCLLAHARKSLRGSLFDEEQLARLAADPRDAALEEADVAVIEFAEKLSTDAASMDDADTQRLRDVGFSDRQIVDIALTAGARNFFSRVLLALAVPVDDVPGLTPALTAALRAQGEAARSGSRISGG
ncbi:carboxymuconolactone decarboxylase family protein [Microbacterium sp. ZW T2_14]|uniref:carboxymuconolactone decarboxylase family protein n=1 Tax=Microbacterium sp. ZW T2_14 TaxID=3378079 RepID=UPI0038531BC9